MSKCRYDLSEDCNNRDCLACVLDKIRAEIKALPNGIPSYWEEFASSLIGKMVESEDKKMTKDEKKKYVDAYNKLVDLAKDGYLKKEPFDQAIRDLLFEIISKFDKEITEYDASKILDMTCHGCIYEDLTAYSYPCLSCKRIHECQSEDCYKDEEDKPCS